MKDKVTGETVALISGRYEAGNHFYFCRNCDTRLPTRIEDCPRNCKGCNGVLMWPRYDNK